MSSRAKRFAEIAFSSYHALAFAGTRGTDIGAIADAGTHAVLISCRVTLHQLCPRPQCSPASNGRNLVVGTHGYNTVRPWGWRGEFVRADGLVTLGQNRQGDR
jgi:hypothetical protein